MCDHKGNKSNPESLRTSLSSLLYIALNTQWKQKSSQSVFPLITSFLLYAFEGNQFKLKIAMLIIIK